MYFETIVTGNTIANSKTSVVKYLVNAETFGEAEEKSYKEAQSELTDLSVRSIRRSRIQKVSKVDNVADGYFCCVIAAQDEKGKTFRMRVLVPSNSLRDAEKSVIEDDLFNSGFDTIESVITTQIQAVL